MISLYKFKSSKNQTFKTITIFLDLNNQMNKQPANINRLDDYISSFYDDNIEIRLKASKEIL